MNPNPCSRRPRIGCCGDVVEQRVRTLERALRFAARAKHVGWPQGREAFASVISSASRSVPSGACSSRGNARSVMLMHSSRAEVRKRGFGGLGVVAQRGHRLAASLEVHRELRGGDRRACGALAFERGADFAVKLRPSRWRRALVQHLAEERVPERIRQLCRIAAFLGTRGDEPQLLARELVACLADPGGVPLERCRDRIDAELDAANGGRREQRALLARRAWRCNDR